MSRNGALLRMVGHGYTATVAAAGATLVSLEHEGRPLIVPFDASADVGRGYQGRSLVPWPNRIAGGAYEFGGVRYEVPVNEAATGSALHGLGSWVPWVVEHATDTSVELSLDLPASFGYPFDVTCGASYRLTVSGLSVRLWGRNDGHEPAPFGVSAHPYLTPFGAGLDAATLTSPAAQVLLVDEHMAPVEVVDVAGTDWDYRDATPMAGRRVDHAFAGLPAEGWRVVVTDAAGRGAALASDAPWVQLYSGEALDRAGIAVEPMTCAPDAFNGPDADVMLAPGRTCTLAFTLAAV